MSGYSNSISDINGNVSIGNTAVSEISERLNVTGNGIALEATDGGITTLLGTFGSSNSIIGTYSNDNLEIRTNNTSRLFISNSGKVGIGATDPGYKLDVHGTFRSTGAGAIQGRFSVGTSSSSDIDMLRAGGNYITATNAAGVLYFRTVNDIRMTISNDGNVGIGTTNPTERFQVYESGLTAYKSYTTTGAGAILTAYQSTFSPFTKTTDLVAGSDGTVPSEIRFLTRDSGVSTVDERMRITSGGELIINGTTSTYGVSQGYPLHVKGTASQSYVSICRGTQNSGSEGLIVGTDSSNAYLLSRDNIPLILGSNNLSHVFIKPSGNVGIGTTNPNNILELYKTVDSAIGPVLQLTNSQYTNADNSGSSIQFRGYTLWGPGSTNPRYSEINAINGGGSVPKRIEFKFYADTDVKTPLSILQTGNVGIGTTSPDSLLELAKSASGTQYEALRLTNTFDNANMGAYISWHDSYATNQMELVSQRNGANNGSIFTFRQRVTGAQSDVLVLNNGNVGINNTSPNSKLEVTGDTASALLTLKSENGGSNDAFMRFFDEAGGGSYSVGLDSSDAKFKIAYDTDGDSLTTGTKLVMDTSGNVGIGTTSPERALHIDANGARPFIQIDKGGDKIFSVGTGTSANDDDNTILQMFDEGTEKIRLYTVGDSYFNGGNVGIGTTSPEGRLELNGSGQSWTTAPGIRMWDSFNSKGWFVGSANNVDAGDFYIRTLPGEDTNPSSSQQEFTIKHASGNVGIGTTSPSEKLEVSGNVKATNFILSSDASLKEDVNKLNVKVDAKWRSYKFKDEYEVRYGVIAQELEETNPELVKTDDKGLKSVKYIDLLIAKIAELEARLEKAGL